LARRKRGREEKEEKEKKKWKQTLGNELATQSPLPPFNAATLSSPFLLLTICVIVGVVGARQRSDKYHHTVFESEAYLGALNDWL